MELEMLSTAGQIAVALAGFAGVVVVFRRESVHEWSPIDKFRLRSLLLNSVLPLALCMIALLLLTISSPPAGSWRWCSGVAFVFLLFFGISVTSGFRRVGVQRLQGASGNFIFYFFATLAIGATLLQLYNTIFLGAFWPFFTGIVLQLAGCSNSHG